MSNVRELPTSGNPRADTHGWLDELIAAARERRRFSLENALQKAHGYAEMDRTHRSTAMPVDAGEIFKRSAR